MTVTSFRHMGKELRAQATSPHPSSLAQCLHLGHWLPWAQVCHPTEEGTKAE